MREFMNRGAAIIAALVSIATILSVCFALLQIVFGDNWCERILDKSCLPPLPTVTPITTATPSQSLIGLWEYQKPRKDMPNPAQDGQVILANGDIDNSNTCHIKVFPPNVEVGGLGEGTFELWLLTGTSPQIEKMISNIQSGSSTAESECSLLPQTSP
jgi:hypothetical protein